MNLKLTDKKKREILENIKNDINAGEEFFNNELRPVLEKAYKIYDGDKSYYKKLLPKLTKSNLVSHDLRDTVLWAMPSLMRIFYGGEGIGDIQGRGAEDTEKAKLLSALINYQINTLNKGFLILYRWMHDALTTGIGVVKGSWIRQDEWSTFEKVFSAEELENIELSEDIKILNMEKLNDIGTYFRVRYKAKTDYLNYPKLENIPATELLFDPSAKSVEEARFMIHRKTITISELRKLEKLGIYSDVEEAIENATTDIDLNYETNDLYNRGQSYVKNNYGKDNPRREVILYECYTKVDIDGDGILEDCIITTVGDVIIRAEENPYKCYPFFVLAPYPSGYKIFGDGFFHLVEDLQNLKTALLRQIVVNISANNDRKVAIDITKVNREDLEEDNAVVECRGNPAQAVREFDLIPYDQSVYSFYELLEALVEKQTGVNRYYQGLSPDAMNKTATGIQAIMAAAGQRIEMISRMFAETGMRDLYIWLITANQLFIDQPQVIRLYNEPIEISPDDIQGKYDYVVKVGLGLGEKERQIANMQLLIKMLVEIGLQLGIATKENIYNAFKILLNNMGYKNVEQFLTLVDNAEQQINPEGVNINLQQQQAQDMLNNLLGGMNNAGTQ